MLCFFFFFKQKTAYELRISDWSSDVCSSDLPLQSMTLADGRQLTWQEFGLPDGRPVLYFHGGGSFSLEAGIFHREAVQRNIHLIATNRPGAGGSSLCPGRPVAAYSNDLRELFDHLKIEKFACLGESTGGPVPMVEIGRTVGGER